MASYLKPGKGPVLSRNDERWESLKQEIQRVYLEESNTLPQTMLKIEQADDFKASYVSSILHALNISSDILT